MKLIHKLTFEKYTEKTREDLRDGAFLCTRYHLFIPGYFNIKFYDSVLTGARLDGWNIDVPKTEMFIAFLGDEAVAVLMFLKRTDRKPNLASCFVVSKHRRKGFATKLWLYARENTRRKVFVAQTSRPDGIAFYNKVGVDAR